MERRSAARRLAQYLVVAVGLAGAAVLGLAAQAIIAGLFGAGADTDALFMARDISLAAFKLLLPAQAAGVLVPMFLAMRSRSREAWEAMAAVLVTVLAVATPIVLVTVLAAPWIVDLLAPGFEESTADQTAVLLRILALSTWLMLVTTLATALLQALERFGLASATNVLGQATLVATLPVLAHTSGITGAAWAFAAAAAMQAALSWGLLLREGLPVSANPLRNRAVVREFLRGLAPFLGYAAAVQASGVVFRISASLLKTGLFAAQSLARQLYTGLFGLIFVPLTTVVFPSLSRHSADDRPEEFGAELSAALRYSVFLVTPVSVILAALAEPAVSLFFERGEFTDTDAHNTGLAMTLFAAVLLVNGLYLLLEQAAYARRENRLIVGTNIRIEAVHAPLYLGLTLAFGVIGIPMAMVAGGTFGTAYYLYRLRRTPGAPSVRLGGGFLVRVALCAAGMAAVVLGTWLAFDSLLDPGPGLPQAAAILPAAALGAVVYCGLSLVAGLRELPNLTALFEARLRRRREQ